MGTFPVHLGDKSAALKSSHAYLASQTKERGKMTTTELRMVQITSEAKLKKLLKAAVVEVLEERRDLVRDALTEAVEDAGMIQAIQKGSRSAPINRDAVFRFMRKRR
jgi:hypothetical protein